MHSSFFTPAIGLAILSITSARVLEKRETCWQDPAYKGLWNNPEIYDDVNPFCAGLLGLQAGNYCVFNKTATITSRESVTATSTITTARTVPSTRFETITNTIFHFNKRDVHDAVTNADFLKDARLAIKRQAPAAGALNLEGPLHSACSCGNAAGRITLIPTPEICTNFQTKWEQGFATAYAYTRTITSGITTVTVIVNETGVISTSKVSATSFAPVSLTSSAEDVAPTYDDQGHWWRDHGFHSPLRSATQDPTSTTTSATTSTTSVSVKETTSIVESTTTTTSTKHHQSTWGDWIDFNLPKSTSVQVDATISNATSATSTSSSSTTVEVTTTTSVSTSTASTSSNPNSPLSRTLKWEWSDQNITTTKSAVPVSPTVVNTTSLSTSSTQNATSKTVTLAPNTTTSSFEVSPTLSNATTTGVLNATSSHEHWQDWKVTKTSQMVSPTIINATTTGLVNTTTSLSGWQDWNVTKTSHMVHPTLINATTTSSVYPNATTTSLFNTTTTPGYQNTTTSSLYNATSTMISPNLTSTTASTTCPGQSTVYLGNLTTTITSTVNFTQPGNTVTQFVSITQSARTVTKTKTVTEYKNKRPHRGGWGGHW